MNYGSEDSFNIITCHFSELILQNVILLSVLLFPFFQIYDENESLWLVEVVPGEGQYAGHRLLDDRTWHALVPKLQALQMSSAVVSCQYDRR